MQDTIQEKHTAEGGNQDEASKEDTEHEGEVSRGAALVQETGEYADITEAEQQ